MIPLAEQIDAVDPQSGKKIKVVGVDASTGHDSLIVLVIDEERIYADHIPYAKKQIPWEQKLRDHKKT